MAVTADPQFVGVLWSPKSRSARNSVQVPFGSVPLNVLSKEICGLVSLRSSCAKSPLEYSRRVTSYSSVNSAVPCAGLRTSAYIMRLPYSASCVISVFTGALTFTKRTVWCSSVCATGAHTRTTFVPGGMSLTVKEYVKRNLRMGWLNFGFSAADCAHASDTAMQASSSDDKRRGFITNLLLSMVNFEWEIGPRLEGRGSSEADEAHVRRMAGYVHGKTV